MTTILITGANKGLGYETARQLIAAGHTVCIGARDPERGREAAERLGARFVHLDVTDDASVAAAAKTIEADGGLVQSPLGLGQAERAAGQDRRVCLSAADRGRGRLGGWLRGPGMLRPALPGGRNRT